MKKIIIGALVLSGGLLFAQEKTMPSKKDTADRNAKTEMSHAAHFDKMQKELQLNSDQIVKLKALHEASKLEHDAQRAKMMDMRKARMEEHKAKRIKHQAQMKSILSKEQYAKWEAMQAEKKLQRKAYMKDQRNKKPMVNKGGVYKKTVIEKPVIDK